jgi:hypothetical protein
LHFMRRLPALSALACALFACTGAQGVAVVPTSVGPPTQALIAWATFPAGQTPRPVLLTGSAPVDSFATSLNAKMAAVCHKLTTSIPLSTAVPRAALVGWWTGTKTRYPSTSAAATLAAMTQLGPQPSQSVCAPVIPAVVTAVRFGTHAFFTDRGIAQIDSWVFTMPAIGTDIAYPALAPSALWNADLSKISVAPGPTLSASGLVLRFSFTGSVASGPCGSDYRGVVAESTAAVAVAIEEIAHSNDPNMVCPAVAQPRVVDVPLASPLGGRVLLDGSGKILPVCPIATPDLLAPKCEFERS